MDYFRYGVSKVAIFIAQMRQPLFYLLLDISSTARRDARQLVFKTGSSDSHRTIPQRRIVGWIGFAVILAMKPSDDNPSPIFELASKLRVVILELVIDVGLDSLDIGDTSVYRWESDTLDVLEWLESDEWDNSSYDGFLLRLR